MNAMNSQQRNVNIDLLKLLACVGVVGLHTLNWDWLNLNVCGFAIPIFFFASGYILMQRKELSVSYCLKRIVRILRLSLTWNFLLCSAILALKVLRGQEIDVVYWIKNYTYYPFIQRGDFWQFWFFGAMILLCILMPFVHKLAHISDKWWCLLWGISAATCVGFEIASMVMGTPIQAKIIQTFRIWTWLQYFLLGGGNAYLQPSPKRQPSGKMCCLLSA